MIDPCRVRVVRSVEGVEGTRVRAAARAVGIAIAVPIGMAIALGVLPASGRVLAQDGELSATVMNATAAPTVGDPITLHVRVTHPAGTTIVWPDVSGRWGPFEVSATGPRLVPGGDGAAAGGPGVVEQRVITATAFVTGTLRTPALRLIAVDMRGVTQTIVAAPIDVAIRSVLDPNDAAPRGPRGPVELPMPSRWPRILGGISIAGALLTLLVWALVRLFRRDAPAEAEREQDPDFRSPLELAYAALHELAAADLPARGRVIEHYTRLADTLRLFVERAYHVPALERTTPELAAAFGPPGARDAEMEPLLAVLSDADLVKFARIIPGAGVARESLADAQALLGGLWGAAERRRIAAEAAAARAASLDPGVDSLSDGRTLSDELLDGDPPSPDEEAAA